MNIIESLRNYFATCPLLAGGQLRVDFLPPEAASYSLDATTCEPVVKRYMDGSTVRQQTFVIASRAYYGADTRTQLDNIGLYEQLQSWLETQTRSGNFPNLGTGRKTRTLQATSCGYAFAESEDFACYQIQLNLTYLQEV